MAGESIIDVDDGNFKDVIKDGVILVDFYAQWCGHCKKFTPFFEEVADELGEKLKFARLDVDQGQKATAELNVTSIPAIVLFKDGEETGRHVGLCKHAVIKELISTAF